MHGSNQIADATMAKACTTRHAEIAWNPCIVHKSADIHGYSLHMASDVRSQVIYRIIEFRLCYI